MCDPSSRAEKELRRGLAALQLGHVDEAVPALETAAEGIVDAAEPLGRAYRLQGRYRDAERAWLRVLRHTSTVPLRASTAKRLADLYGDLGGPEARADILTYRKALETTSQPEVPPERVRRKLIRRRGTAEYYVKGSGGGFRRRWWRLLRMTALALTGLATLLGIVEGIDWLMHRFF